MADRTTSQSQRKNAIFDFLNLFSSLLLDMRKQHFDSNICPDRSALFRVLFEVYGRVLSFWKKKHNPSSTQP